MLALFAQDAEVDALLSRSAEARDRGDLEESLRLMKEAHQLTPAPELLNNVGYLLQLLGRYREAVAIYERVIADPASSAELVELDRRRNAELATKVDYCWVAVDRDIANDLRIDGERVDPTLEEIALGRGDHVLELLDAGTVLRWTRFPLGERSKLDRSFFSKEHDSALIADVPLESLVVDGYSVVHLDVARVMIPPGQHRIEARIRARGEVRLTRHLDPRSALSLAAIVTPMVAPEAEASSLVLPAITVGIGAAGIAAGTTLAILATRDRATVENSSRNDEGLIIGLTYPEAKALEERANDRANAGVVALSLGAAVAAAGVLWWLLE